ncbi:MAG: four helix bundle protein [Flavobacteriales bacterium]|nr:MAG: four helix bundle protein [Flavobacteriales bacterium]
MKDKSFAFAVRVVKAYKIISSDKKEFVMSKQLLRSGTGCQSNLKPSRCRKTIYGFNDFSGQTAAFKRCSNC